MTHAVNIEVLKRLYLTAKKEAEDASQLLADLHKPLDEQIAALEKAFSFENEGIIKQAAESADAASDYETQLREAAIAYFHETGTKTLDENLSVRVSTKLIYDQQKAVEWAEKNAPVMIQKTVDKKAFESLPTVTDLDFVEKQDNVSAVIKGL